MRSPQTFFLCSAAAAVKIAAATDALRDRAGHACLYNQTKRDECKHDCKTKYKWSFANDWKSYSTNQTALNAFCEMPANATDTTFGVAGGPSAEGGSYSPQQSSASDCGGIYEVDVNGTWSINVDPYNAGLTTAGYHTGMLTKHG